MSEFPVRARDIDPAWIEAQLARAGVLGAARITGLTWEPIGTGQVGDTARFSLQYDREDDALPATLAAKFAASDPTSRQTAASFSLYRKEVMFYRQVAHLTGVRVPRVYAAEVDCDGCEFVLLFEDLGPCRAGNQLDGCSFEQARQAVLQAAALHAPTMDHAMLDADWLQPNDDAQQALRHLYPKAQAVFRERYASELAPEFMAICEDLADNLELWFDRKPARRSFLHGDFRLDNMLFDVGGGAEPIAIVDWQTAAVGCNMTDIGYFLGCGIGPDLRRKSERPLLDAYCAEMTRLGVPLQTAQVWEDYAIGALHGVSTAVFSAAFVVRTERGDANFLSMARGACDLALEHDSMGKLKRRMEHV